MTNGSGDSDPFPAVWNRLSRMAIIAATIGAFLLVTFRARFNPDVVALVPKRADAGALARYIRAFGGGGLSVILVQGPDAAQNEAAAERITNELAAKPSVAFAAHKVTLPSFEKAPDPLLLFRYADPGARRRLAAALEPDAMRARLAETKSMLLAPGSGAMKDYFVADPLRLSQVVFEGGGIGAGVKARSDGLFATDDGTSHVIVVKPKGQALRGADARAFMADVDGVLAPVRAENPGMKIGVTGPHAIAAATEKLVRDDVWLSGVLSLVLASVVFLAIFRRVRALVAITPPLLLGTLWTAALASLWSSGISAIAMAFASVVVGVGFDTGVHVYAALLDARREGLSPRDAVRAARERTARPVLIAAVIAGFAFASLAFSSIEALGQLGVLCGAGEVLTALAIVVITPEVGGLLERGTPPKPVSTGWTRWIHALTSTRRRAAVALALSLVAAFAWVPLHLHVADSIVAVRPDIPPIKVEDDLMSAFGGKRRPWTILVADKDRDKAMYRADRLAEALAGESEVIKVDALTPLVPSVGIQEDRFAARDALLEGKADELARALHDAGFADGPFAATIESMRHPTHDTVQPDKVLSGDLAVLGARFLATDGDETLAVLNVHLGDDPDARERMERAVRAVDDRAFITGYARLEADLHASLGTDLPLIGGVAATIVLVLLGVSLRRPKEVAIAMGVLAIGIGCLLSAIAALKIPLHIFSSLVIPVLLGITVDEAMFLLHHARHETGEDGRDPILSTLEREGPPVLATALTTSAGFAALAVARYSALADLGLVGALGSGFGLVVALVIVPAGLRLLGVRATRAGAPPIR